MSIVRLDPFDLEVGERFTLVREDQSAISVTCTEPPLAVRCVVLDVEHGQHDVEATASAAAQQHLRGGGRVVNVFRTGENGYCIVLGDERALKRTVVFTYELNGKVLLVQGTTLTSEAAEADGLMAELLSPVRSDVGSGEKAGDG